MVLGLGGCATSYPHLSFAVEQRLLRETTLDDMDVGKAGPGDALVRVTRTGREGGSCSGAIIGPRHVLTAEHCMMKMTQQMERTDAEIVPGDVHVELGGDYLPWGRVGVREIHGCPGYHDDAEHDLAVIILSKPVPNDVPIFSVSFDVPDEAGIFDLAGFGTAVKPKNIPDTSWFVMSVTRHVHRGPIVDVTPGTITVEIPGEHGDSGGPIVDAHTGAIVSVVSRGNASEVRKDGELPRVDGPRLISCKKTIETALAR
jgi:hypothetical protein